MSELPPLTPNESVYLRYISLGQDIKGIQAERDEIRAEVLESMAFGEVYRHPTESKGLSLRYDLRVDLEWKRAAADGVLDLAAMRDYITVTATPVLYATSMDEDKEATEAHRNVARRAAPDLLEACKDALEDLKTWIGESGAYQGSDGGIRYKSHDCESCSTCEAIEKLEAAIAMAEPDPELVARAAAAKTAESKRKSK